MVASSEIVILCIASGISSCWDSLACGTIFGVGEICAVSTNYSAA